MRGLEEIYLKGFSYDKYLGIASKEELEKLDELYKNIVISDEFINKIKSVNKKISVLASVETWCPFARVFLTTMRKINEINYIFDLSLITYGRGVSELAGYLKIGEDDFVVPTAVFLDESFSKLRVFNGFPEKYHNDNTLDTIDGTRNYLKGKSVNDILEDILMVF
ncbi:thioredoxin family protein [Fusobacterium canifelinum]|uniref:Thioredoxin family protein n=1 Tax=Fusobacterium canifelinum TaxID=285729 RepID=A0ABX7CAQ4_9FUSO|nr:thioredoxin family protein [Fusobacterium canifelinum]QQS86618.1 thioredoxin family protein [Fusobacterium canifelinum]